MAKFEREETESFDRPQGRTILEISDIKKLQAEFGEFDGKPNWSLRYWIQRRDGTWIRSRQGIPMPRDKVFEFHRNLNSYIEAAKDKSARRARR